MELDTDGICWTTGREQCECYHNAHSWTGTCRHNVHLIFYPITWIPQVTWIMTVRWPALGWHKGSNRILLVQNKITISPTFSCFWEMEVREWFRMHGVLTQSLAAGARALPPSLPVLCLHKAGTGLLATCGACRVPAPIPRHLSVSHFMEQWKTSVQTLFKAQCWPSYHSPFTFLQQTYPTVWNYANLNLNIPSNSCFTNQNEKIQNMIIPRE